MKQQAIEIIEEMIKEIKNRRPMWQYEHWYVKWAIAEIEEAKSRIQALWDGCEVQTLKIWDECYFSNNCITWRKWIFNWYASWRYTLHNFAMKNMPLPLPPK